MLVSFTGSFDDVGAAKEAAPAQVSAGADLLFHNADAAGLGAFQAAVQSHIYAFGTNGDQNAVAPENVLASAVTHIPKAFVRNAKEIKTGEFRGGMLEYGMKDGMVEVVHNPRLQSKISAARWKRPKRPSNKSSPGKSFLSRGKRGALDALKAHTTGGAEVIGPRARVFREGGWASRPTFRRGDA